MEKQQPNKKPQPPHVGFPRNSNSDAINQYYKENLNKGPAAEYLPAVVIDLVVEYTQERFYVGRLVNVQDIFSKWVVGRVVKFFGNNFEEVQIHFESWPGKIDETMTITSSRLAPFGTHSARLGSSNIYM